MPSAVAASPSPPAPAVVDRLEAFLAELIAGLEPAAGAAGRNRGRPPILPATVLWAGLAVCVLRRATSQLDVWRLLSANGLWDFPAIPVSDDAVYKRLEQDGAAAMERLFADVSALLAVRLDAHADRTLAPFAAEVFAIDETALDPVARRLPALRGVPPGDDRLLPGKVAGVFDIRRQLWRGVTHVAAPRQNEKVAARDAVASLPPGSLLLFDLGYFAFAWFDDLTDAGRHWVSRLREKTSYVPIHVFYADGETLDALVWLGAHRADRAKHAARLVQFRRGATLHRYLTNVRDPHRLPLAEIARLYARRWDIEMAVDLAKTELGLHLLWSAKPPVILAQVWAVLLIAQVVQALRVLVAAAAGVAPFGVSLPLLVRYLPQYARRGHDPIAAFVADGARLGFIRPSRRTVTIAPVIPPDALHPPPPDLVLLRSPRYAQKGCGPRPRSTSHLH
ncbi:MAG: IS4 family transposase [Chloroflexota bacterium]|nr:IS4 family transposase [Chloroflexota bacterium]